MKGTVSLAFALLALACTHAHADPAQGSETRQVGAFDAIEVAGTMVVEARIDTTTKVEVQGDADLLKLVSTTVKNGALVVETPRDFVKQVKRKDSHLKVVVTVPALKRVAISGTGVIQLDGFTGKSLDAAISGIGSLRLAGKTERLRLEVPGTAEVKAKDLIAADVDLAVSGTAEATLHATRSFASDVSGTAVVKVRGKPATVKKRNSGVAMIDVN